MITPNDARIHRSTPCMMAAERPPFDAPNCLPDVFCPLQNTTNTTQPQVTKRRTPRSILALTSPNPFAPAVPQIRRPSTHLIPSFLCPVVRAFTCSSLEHLLEPVTASAYYVSGWNPHPPYHARSPPFVPWCWALRDEGDEHDGRTGQYPGDQDHPIARF